MATKSSSKPFKNYLDLNQSNIYMKYIELFFVVVIIGDKRSGLHDRIPSLILLHSTFNSNQGIMAKNLSCVYQK